MAVSAVSLKCEGSNWNAGLVERLHGPFKKAALDVTDGVDYLDVDIRRPKKGSVLRFPASYGPNVLCDGNALNSANFVITWVLNRSEEINYRRQAWLASTALHELVHCERFRYVSCKKDSLYEWAATEGLAYTAESLFIDEFFPSVTKNPLTGMNLERDDRLDERFIHEAEIYEKHPNHPSFYKWMDKSNSKGIALGSKVGIRAVSEFIEAGYNIGELLQCPAKEILGFE